MYNIASKIKNHRLYQDFLKVKATLAQHQFVCWIAGGAVRDFCLDREVNEFDLVTDATTEVLKNLFPEAVLVGESFGVLKLPLANNEFFDLATFRQESDYVDGRRPSHVESATPFKDSERRDFTVNAMYWDDIREVIIDYKGGQFDLTQKCMRCVGVADVRFSEDYLRIIRLVRFSSVLGFTIEKKTNAAAVSLKHKINQVSGERVWSELLKISKAGAWNRALQQELFLVLLEEVFELSLVTPRVIEGVNSDIIISIYLLAPENDFSEILKKKLKLSNQDLAKYKAVRYLIEATENLNIAELSYEVEKNVLYDERLKLLTEVGLVNASIYESVKHLLSSQKEALVMAKDVLGVIPQNQISTELKSLRIAQLEGRYRTKAEVMEYLGKKYAK